MLAPWEQCPDVWPSEAAYFKWVRGQLRLAWNRHPVKLAYKKSKRVRARMGRPTKKYPQGQEIWACRCECCGKLFRESEIEVDHIDEAGSFRNWEEADGWVRKLLHISFESLQNVCKRCHRIKSYADTYGISFEEAEIEKEAIAFEKLSAGKQIEILSSLGITGATNNKTRRAAYRQHLIDKKNANEA